MTFIWLADSGGRNRFIPDPDLRVRFVESGDGLRAAVADREPAAIIIEAGPGAAIDLEVLETWGGRYPVWILATDATVSSSVWWIKLGAAHVATGAEEIRRQMRLCEDIPLTGATTTAGTLIGASRAMTEVQDRVRMVADRKCTVLIEGETGTGKEVVARAIHASGNRARGPWVAVNCGAIPEALLEAELFGYVKGAFTGAAQSRPGKFEAANRGTIFLDEIGDMPMPLQGRLLRVLQEREVVRLGANESVRLDVRVIAATNARLEECVRNGTFRQDLFYRLNVFRIDLPPLRERKDDIAALAERFAARVCAAEKLAPRRFDPAAVEKLRLHSWPGNVRELENTIESAVISSGHRAVIFPSDITWTDEFASEKLPAETAPALPSNGIDYERVIGDFEKSLLTQALSRTRGNKTAAASLLGMKRTTLAARMRALESRMPRLVA